MDSMMDFLAAFHFLRPWCLLILPLWVWLSLQLWQQLRSGDGWSAICDPALLSYLVGTVEKQQRSRLALSALMLAGCMAVLALAGPVWQQLPQPVFRAQSALVIGLDLSRSMLAADMKPNRLQRAKQKLQDILSLRKEGQTALVVFAGTAFDVVPMTSDNRAILAMLDALEPSMMPAQGSRASTALKHASAIFKRNAIVHGSVLLLTDGVDAEATQVADRLVRAGHRVSVIGVGTEAGAPIPDSGEQGGFVKDQHQNIVIPRLLPASLRQLAEAGHGVYQHIHFDDTDIHHIPGLKPSATAMVTKQEKLQTDLWREAGPWLLLLVLPLLSLVFRRGVLLSLLLLPLLAQPDAAQAMAWKDLWQTPDQQAQQLMQQGKTEAAADLFHNPDWKGAALYKAKKYQPAADALNGANSADGWYNRGNALAKAGDLKGALEAYDHALKLDKAHQDAQFNRDLVKQAMQQQSKKSDKHSSDKKQSDEKKSNKKKSDQKKSGQKESEKKESDQQQGEQQKSGQQSDDKQSSDKQSSDKKSSEKQQSGQQGQQNQPADNKDQQADASKSDAKQTKQKAQDAKKAEKARQAQAMKQQQDAGGKQHRQQAASQADRNMDPKQKEASAAIQQWLRRIPDDPGGLLRRKFRYQYQQQNPSSGAGDKAW